MPAARPWSCATSTTTTRATWRAQRWRAGRLALATAVGMGALGGLIREPLAARFTVDEAPVVANLWRPPLIRI